MNFFTICFVLVLEEQGGEVMKKIVAVMIAIILLFSISIKVRGCWEYLSIEDLFEMADDIIIGRIVKQDNRLVDSPDDYTDYWLVKVDVVLRGSIEKRQVIITTPGEGISTQFSLGNPGEQVLLFLATYDQYLTPITPQGVVGITLAEEAVFQNATKLSEVLKVEQGYNDEGYSNDILRLIAEEESVVDMRSIEIEEIPDESSAVIVPMSIGGVALAGVLLIFMRKRD